MKITVNVDCTPVEARNFLGLPDLTPIHDKYLEKITEMMDGSMSLDQMQGMFKNLSPMGDASINLFKQIMDLGLAAGGLGGSSKSDK